MSKVMVIGLKNETDLGPFDSSTEAGQIIKRIEEQSGQEFIKTNLLNYVPVDEKGNIRLPSNSEVMDQIPRINKIIQENHLKLVILFGGMVHRYHQYIEGKKHLASDPAWMAKQRKEALDKYIYSLVETIKKYR